MTSQETVKHIEALCHEYDIVLRYIPKVRRSRAYWGTVAQIDVRRPVSYLTYAIALHEIGHCRTFWRAGFAYPVASAAMRNLNAEVLAWAWAREHALVWTTPMYWTQRHSLRNHRNSALWWAQEGWI